MPVITPGHFGAIVAVVVLLLAIVFMVIGVPSQLLILALIAALAVARLT